MSVRLRLADHSPAVAGDYTRRPGDQSPALSRVPCVFVDLFVQRRSSHSRTTSLNIKVLMCMFNKTRILTFFVLQTMAMAMKRVDVYNVDGKHFLKFS